jgi:UDP-N-acetylmuramate--alanine ligase
MEKISDIYLEVEGYQNVENELAAINIALELGMEGREIRKLMRGYTGVKRRFEYVFRSPTATLIDDYAHHPKEIEAFLKSVRILAGKRKITIIFQPHLFSRTNDFMQGFADALDKADEIILLPIYPAREKPIKGVTSGSILELMENKNKVLVEKEELLGELSQRNLDVVCTVGAGDIDREVPKIASMMRSRFTSEEDQTKQEDE